MTSEANFQNITTGDKARLVHERTFHRDPTYLLKAQKAGLIQAGLTDEAVAKFQSSACVGCGLAKASRRPRPKGQRAHAEGNSAFSVIAMDMMSPVLPVGIGGVRHCLIIADASRQGSGGIWCYGLRSKDAAVQAMKKWVQDWPKRYRPGGAGKQFTFSAVRSDNAGELCAGQMREYLDEIGCQERQKTCPQAEASYQNGAAERAIRTITSMANAAMHFFF